MKSTKPIFVLGSKALAATLFRSKFDFAELIAHQNRHYMLGLAHETMRWEQRAERRRQGLQGEAIPEALAKFQEQVVKLHPLLNWEACEMGQYCDTWSQLTTVVQGRRRLFFTLKGLHENATEPPCCAIHLEFCGGEGMSGNSRCIENTNRKPITVYQFLHAVISVIDELFNMLEEEAEEGPDGLMDQVFKGFASATIDETGLLELSQDIWRSV